jgi:hypothetical protein
MQTDERRDTRMGLRSARHSTADIAQPNPGSRANAAAPVLSACVASIRLKLRRRLLALPPIAPSRHETPIARRVAAPHAPIRQPSRGVPRTPLRGNTPCTYWSDAIAAWLAVAPWQDPGAAGQSQSLLLRSLSVRHLRRPPIPVIASRRRSKLPRIAHVTRGRLLRCARNDRGGRLPQTPGQQPAQQERSQSTAGGSRRSCHRRRPSRPGTTTRS